MVGGGALRVLADEAMAWCVSGTLTAVASLAWSAERRQSAGGRSRKPRLQSEREKRKSHSIQNSLGCDFRWMRFFFFVGVSDNDPGDQIRGGF